MGIECGPPLAYYPRTQRSKRGLMLTLSVRGGKGKIFKVYI